MSDCEYNCSWHDSRYHYNDERGCTYSDHSDRTVSLRRPYIQQPDTRVNWSRRLPWRGAGAISLVCERFQTRYEGVATVTDSVEAFFSIRRLRSRMVVLRSTPFARMNHSLRKKPRRIGSLCIVMGTKDSSMYRGRKQRPCFKSSHGCPS